MSNYWQKRFQAVEEMNNKVAKETVDSITPAFDKAQVQIEKEINAWYQRFAKNNELSLQEAKKLLTTRELKEFRWDVEKYIEFGGPDGEKAAASRYLSQRYSMPYANVAGLLTDIGTEEMAHELYRQQVQASYAEARMNEMVETQTVEKIGDAWENMEVFH